MAQIMNGADTSVMDDGYNDYGDVQADFGYSNMAVPMGFTEMACMSFDHRENLLWVVDKSGHVLSYYRVVLQVYSRFFWPLDKNDTEAHSIVPTSDHVIVIGKCTIAAFSRGGVPEYFYRSDLLTDLSCAHWDPYTNLLFLGGSQDTIVVYDIEIRSERNVIPIKEGSASIIRTTERYLVSASEDGKLTVRSKDLMNYNLIAQTQAHLGKVVDFDVHATYLVCCGMSKKSNGTLVFDNFLKVYDVRNLNPQIPIPFNRHPTVCKFVGIDSLNEEKVVVTSGPMLFLVDILENKLTGLGSLPVPASHLCASDSHQAIAVGMGECPPMVQLFWTEDEDPPFSICDIDPIFPAEDEKDIPIPYDAPTPLATFPLRYCPGMDYCSDRWPDVLMRRRFL
ncbi:unnamed protein product [Bursaphelenchus xylophilus]|nr:unnamed protein product [Bursaphelenchus xylophilus]CAG9105749.1 unnamed protein product [Bursaphelenchus xylophilus]